MVGCVEELRKGKKSKKVERESLGIRIERVRVVKGEGEGEGEGREGSTRGNGERRKGEESRIGRSKYFRVV